MAKYLYGASVQGIQGFIFETNKLREIIGASELVEKICTDLFQVNMFQEYLNTDFLEQNLLIGAAGNIKYLFDEKTDCEKMVKYFPKIVMETAPGINILQAVVKIDKKPLSHEDMTTLNERISSQKNKAIVQHGLGLMISERARRTGKAAILNTSKTPDDKIQDLGTQRKEVAHKENRLLIKMLHKNENKARQLAIKINDSQAFPKEISEIPREDNQWIAIIHADGNNLGKLIQNLTTDIKGKKIEGVEYIKIQREFSTKIEKSTKAAAQTAIHKICDLNEISAENKLPFRPIVLGGDDLTLIIRGDLALDFTNIFLREFEIETAKRFKEFKFKGFNKGLTACAGIAYTKPKFPFHYGVDLAEALCKYSKDIAKGINKNRTPSCLMFHKVHSSFIGDYEDIVRRELTVDKNNSNNINRQLNFGPYFIHETCEEDNRSKFTRKDYSSVKKLQNWINVIQEKNAPKSDLRNWLSQLSENNARAKQLLGRINKKAPKYAKLLYLAENEIFQKRKDCEKNIEIEFTHIQDVLSISNINK